MRQEEARQWVIDAETACLPPTVPLPFTEIITAKFVKKNVVVAEVKMFDGLKATLEVSQQSFGNFPSWGLYWRDLPGGAIDCSSGTWKRVNTSPEVVQVEAEAEAEAEERMPTWAEIFGLEAVESDAVKLGIPVQRVRRRRA